MVMGREKDKMKNRGMSLVELIIVIALMSVILGVTGFGLSLIGNKPVEECAKKIEIVLNRTRINTMGKKEAWVEFYLNDDGRVTVTEHLRSGKEEREGTPARETTTVLGARDVKVRITYSDGSVCDLAGPPYPTAHYRVAFTRDSGAVSDLYGAKCTKIEVYKGTYSDSAHKQTIVLNTLTGKVTVE